MTTQPQHYDRREVLQAACALALGSLVGGAVVSAGAAPGVPHTVRELRQQGWLPTHALSLTQLQRQLAQRSSWPRQLQGLTTIHGLMLEPDGEVIVLGSTAGDLPYDLDALVVALRHTYRVEPAYAAHSLGVTIDPWEGAEDPWRIQAVKVLGMPQNVTPAQRFVSLDYELKRVSAGLLALAPQVKSLYATHQTERALCDQNGAAAPTETVVHRFWFTPRYPPGPRFLKEDQGLVFILQPVGVQLLTEREYLDARGTRQGAAPAMSAAATFAQEMSDLLASATAPERYRRLVKDFQMVEVAQLLRFLHVPPSHLEYLLAHYALARVEVPSFVGGVRRESHEQAVCHVDIVEHRKPQRIEVRSKEHIAQRRYVSRGGVEAQVQLPVQHFAEAPSRMVGQVRQCIRRARPAPQALLWAIGPCLPDHK